MPGPRNQKKKKSAQNKKGPAKKAPSPPPKPVDQVQAASSGAAPLSSSSEPSVHDSRGPSPTPPPATPPPAPSNTLPPDATYEPALPHHGHDNDTHNAQDYPSYPQEHVIYPQYSAYPPCSTYPEDAGALPIPSSLLKPPFIHDPGSGPRVKDVRAFLESRLASPPSLDDPLCGEFADEAVLQMLCTVLPEETAMVRCDTFSATFMPTIWNADSVVQQEPGYSEDMSRVPEVISARRRAPRSPCQGG